MNNEIINIIEIVEKLETRINSYWNFYVVVVVATIGWLMSSTNPFTKEQGIALIVSICMFFAANFSVMRAATMRVVAFEKELSSISDSLNVKTSALRSELSRPTQQGRILVSYVLHIIVDIAVIYAIWSKLFQ